MSADPIRRREFLGGLGAAALFSSCGEEHEDPYALEKPSVPGAAAWTKGEEKLVATACAQCPAGCGIHVRVVEGHAVKIEGNTACLVNRGGIGPRGLAGLQALYDPDRVHQPLLRKGPRGAPEFEPITWEAALEVLARRLGDLREKGEGHRAAIVCGRERGMMLELWRRFAAVYGTPNFFDGFATGNGPVADAIHWMQGIRDIPAYDWTQTRYVLSLGSGILESSCQLVYFARAQAWMRRGQAGVRAKIVHAGVAMSRTAMNADEWITIRPGTYGAFALGIAHVLVQDSTYDQEFVREHCFGFEPWQDTAGVEHAGFRKLLEDYSPDKVAALCAVEAPVVERIAREMASARPCFAVAGPEEMLASNGLRSAMAVHALNALLGAIDRPGGLLVQRAPPLADWPEAVLDEKAELALARERIDGAGSPGGAGSVRYPLASAVIEALPEAVMSGTPYALDTLLLYYANPLYARANPARWRAALEKVPFVVSFTPFLDETASELADLVLPDHTYLERWEDAAPAPSVGSAVFGLRQPVVQPLHDTRATGDVVIQLAKAIGEPLEEAFPWGDFKDAVKQRVAGIFAAKRGSIIEEKGGDFLKRLYEEGYWNDVGYPFGQWAEVLATPSGKFEFVSQALRERLAASGRSAEEIEHLCMPGHEDIAWQGDSARFPLELVLYKPNTYAEGGGANLPWLVELAAWTGRRTRVTEADLHPSTARAAGVADGARIEIESQVGSIVAIARVTDGILPGVVRLPQGGGHTAFGRFARGWGANAMRIVAAGPSNSLTGIPPHCGTRVAVRSAST